MAGTLAVAATQTLPAKSIATIWDAGAPMAMGTLFSQANSPYAARLCEGARLHAVRLGMRVWDATGIADQAMMPHMRQLKAMGGLVSVRNPQKSI